MIIDPDPFDILRNIELNKKVLSWRIWKRMNDEIGTFQSKSAQSWQYKWICKIQTH